MMKRSFALLLIFAILCTVTGCYHRHTWVEADCEQPRTCSECGITEGEALGHDWADADCIHPKTCKRCGKTEGDALGHADESWKLEEINFTIGMQHGKVVCSRCGTEFYNLSKPVETFVEDDHFLFNPDQFMNRLKFCMQLYDDVFAEYTDESLALDLVEGPDQLAYGVYIGEKVLGGILLEGAEDAPALTPDSEERIYEIFFDVYPGIVENWAPLSQFVMSSLWYAVDPSSTPEKTFTLTGEIPVKAREQGPNGFGRLDMTNYYVTVNNISEGDEIIAFNFVITPHPN